jgi:hypothetical protein
MTALRIRLVIMGVAVMALIAPFGFGDSQVRIVRLSDVQGVVEVDRNLHGFEKAFLNLPITQNNAVRTETDGRAQIEFEDGSVLRMTPATTIEFTKLSLGDSGTRMSTVALKSGVTYVDFKDKKDAQLSLIFGREKVVLTRPAHLRIEVSDKSAAVADFGGDVAVESPSGAVQLSKNRTAIFNLDDKDGGKVAKYVDPGPYDAWDKKDEQYQQRYNSSVLSTTSSYTYGLADLNYYGSFFNAPGYGLMWQPYFAGANWDPFMDGAWAFYPGTGYGWVSGYPWGWTPYHSGAWTFISGTGWAWQPGGTWMGVNTRPRVLNSPANFVAPSAPATTGRNLIAVNRGPSTTFVGHSTTRVVLRNNSAGLGVPRGEVNNLAQISQRVNVQGAAVARIHSAAVEMDLGSESRISRTGFDSQASSSSGLPAGRSSVQTSPSSAIHSAPAAGHVGK